MLSLEAINFEIRSVLSITNVFYVKIKMPTFIRKKSQMDAKKMYLNRRKYKIVNV